MAEPYLGEIRLFANTYAPKGFSDCKGQWIPISQNQALFNLLKTTYGGDGITTFQLPDFQGRTAIGQGPGHPMASAGGSESVVLNTDTMPAHTHKLCASKNAADTNNPEYRSLGQATIFANATNLKKMRGCEVTSLGMGHRNIQPSIAIRFVIAIKGPAPL